MAEKKEKRYVSDNAQLMAEWHWEKNNKLEINPTQTTCGSGKKAWWICSNGHEYESQINNRNKNHGCPYCAGNKVLSGFNDLETTHPFLAKEWHPTKNTIISPRDISFGSTKKVWWLGSCGHEWEASPNNRSKGYGCPVCSGKIVLVGLNDLSTVNPMVAEEWHPTKNGTLLPHMVTKGSVKKIWWLGKCGHEWQATVNNRCNGHGCPICVQKSKTSFPEQAIYYYIKKHFHDAVSRYKDILPNKMEVDIYIPSLSIGIEYDGFAWHNSLESQRRDERKYALCQSHNIQLIRIKEQNTPLAPKHCDVLIIIPPNPSCKDLNTTISGLLAHLNTNVQHLDINSERDSIAIKETFYSALAIGSLAVSNPILSLEWHPTKNGVLTPDMFMPFAHDKIWWLGKCGHEWQATIASRSAGRECPYCSNNRVLPGFNDLLTINEELAKEWHHDKNGVLTPHQTLATSTKKVWWLGKCGHEWKASVIYRNNGGGCPYCSGRKVEREINSLAVSNPNLLIEWHPTKNEEKTPYMYSKGSSKIIWWKCSCGHEWQASIHNRTRGHGCPQCAKQKRSLKSSKRVRNDDTGEIFESTKEAREKYRGNIKACCLGNTKTAAGFHWSYIDDVD